MYTLSGIPYIWDPKNKVLLRCLTKMPRGIIPVRRGVWESGSKNKLTGFESKMYPVVKVRKQKLGS